MPRNITVTFDDGSSHVYNNAPDDVTPEQIEARASRDFAGKRVTALDGGRGRPAARQRVPDIPGTPEGYADRVAMIPVRPPEGVPAVTAPPAQRAAPVPQEERGLFARIRAGLEAAQYTVASIVPGAVGYGVGVLEGIARAATNTPPKDWKPGENLAETRARQFVDATVTKPSTALGWEYVQDVGDFAQRHGASVAAGPLGMVGLGRHTRAVGDVRTGLRAALGEPGDAPPGLPPVAPSAEKPAGGLAKRVVQPNPAQLADVPLAEKAGLVVMPHHISENPAVRAAGAAAGGDAYKQNTKTFTARLVQLINPEEKSTQLTEKVHGRALDRAGKRIGEKMAGIGDVSANDALISRLEAISREAAENGTAETARMVGNRINALKAKIEAGGGKVSGTYLKELDTAIGQDTRGFAVSDPNLARRLGKIQSAIRDFASEHMDAATAAGLKEDRRHYAYSMTILPDVAEFGRTGYMPLDRLWKRVTSDDAGRLRVAQGRGGPLVDLAKAGALVADRSGTGHGYVSVGSGGVGVGTSGVRAYADPSRLAEITAGVVLGKKAYNRWGPNLTKRLAAEFDAEQARAAQAPEPPPLELAPEGAPTPRAPRFDVRGEAPAEVPEWVVGVPDRVARPGDQIPAIEPEGLLPAVGDDIPPVRIIHGAGETRRIAPQTRAVDPEDPGALPQEEAPRKLRGPAEPAVTTPGQVAAQRAAQPPLLARRPAEIKSGVRRPRVPDIPAVPGRPDLPDVMVAGGPGEVAGNLTSGVTGAGREGPLREATGTNEAMLSPDAALARVLQGYAPKKPPEPPTGGAGGTGPSGGKPPTDPRLAEIAELRRRSTSPAVTKVLDAREAEVKKTIKRETDIAELEAAAQATDDVDLRQSLLAEANKLRGGKLPVGEVKEGQPDLPKPKTEKIPVGEATEIIPEVVEAAPERLPVGEATEMPERLPVGEVVEDPIPVGEAMEFELLPVGEVTEITPEVVEPARGPVVPEATNVDNAPTTPAGGGRSEGMEQQKAKRPANGIAAILYETPNFHVRDAGSKGYEVYQVGATASTKVASIGHGKGPGLGLERAKAEADRRQAALPKPTEAPKEPSRAPQEVTQQAGVPAEPQGRTGGREAAEAGAGDRVQRAAEGGGQAEGAKKEGVKSAAHWAEEMAQLRAVRPSGIARRFGKTGPTPEQRVAYDAEVKAWNAKYRKASAEQKKALDRDNAAFRAQRSEAPVTKPTGKALSPAEVKAEFQRQIDAVPRFDDGGPETITLKAGSSTARIQNTARRVAEYMKALDTVKGGKTPKPVSEKKAGITGSKMLIPANKKVVGSKAARRANVKTWGGELSKRAPLKTITDMIDDIDPQAAVDFAAAQGIDLEVALKDDRKRLDLVRGLKPTPDTP